MWTRLFGKTRRPASRHSSARPRLEALEDRCLLSAGALDTTFGSTGVVSTSLSKGSDIADAVLIQPWDGKIVLAGHTQQNSGAVMSLARYNADGSLDSTFGSGGKEVSKIGTNSNGDAAALYPHAGTANDGKIVEAGAGSLARFNANGSVDTSFGNRGLVAVSATSNIVGVVIQADGKIVVAGDNKVIRYNANGSLDTTFGSSGIATFSLGSGGFLTALDLQADGKLVAAVTTGSNALELARFNANCSLDTTFDSAGPVPGTVTTTFATPANLFPGLAIYPSTGTDSADYGKIVAVGSISGNPGGVNDGQPALARYNADGTPDVTFGQAGEVVTPLPNSGGGASAVAIQADGKVVASGRIARLGGGQWQFGLLRYNTNGSLDTTFGNGGIAQTANGTGDSQAGRIAIQADGRIVVAGKTQSSTSWDFMVARYLPGPEIGTFAASASTVTDGSSLTLAASNLTDGDPVATITQVAFYAIDVNGNQYVLGTGTLSSGVWTLNYTVSLASGSYTLFAQATDSDGIVGDSAFLPLSVSGPETLTLTLMVS